jgi:hypothetical protein
MLIMSTATNTMVRLTRNSSYDRDRNRNRNRNRNRDISCRFTGGKLRS